MFLKQLLHLYDHSYNHPSYKQGDPARPIPSKYRNNIFFYNIGFWGGIFTIVISSFLFIKFLPMADIYSFRFGKDFTETKGKIIIAKQVNYSENDVSYYEYRYVYDVKGTQYKGSSFDAYREEFEKDSTVQIQYQNTSPSTSRIKGMRMAPGLPFAVPFIFMFVCLGVGISIATLLDGMNQILLLRHGIITEALITETILFRNPDNESVNTNDVYIEFVTKTGNTVKTKINISASKMARPGKNASILYLPWNTSESVFVKSLNPEERQILESY